MPTLTAKQQVTADRWAREKAERKRLLDEAAAAEDRGDYEEAKRLRNAWGEVDALQCEHERHWSSNCAACDEIERILYPENFTDEDEDDEEKTEDD